MKVLVACECSGRVRDAFAKRGHNAWSCDLKPSEVGGKHLRCNVLDILTNGWDLMVCHPPCDYLAVVSAFYWKLPGYEYFLKNQPAAIAFAKALWNAPIERICLENPRGVLSTHMAKPTQTIDPTQFGHACTKRTDLWLKNLPLLRPPSPFELPVFEKLASGTLEWVNKKRKAEDRSRTFPNIAWAMAQQWG